MIRSCVDLYCVKQFFVCQPVNLDCVITTSSCVDLDCVITTSSSVDLDCVITV